MLKKISACILAAALLLFLIELNNFDFDSEAIYVDEVAESDDISQQEIYNDLFDHNSVVKIDINISRNELAKIQNDYEYYKAKKSKSPIYRIAESVTFTVNGKKYIIKEVGIRMKGSSSLSNFYNDILGTYNLVSFKLKFNETFDNEDYYSAETKRWNSEEEREQRESRTFATLQKLDVKWNSSFDNTYVRNMYVQDMYRDYGILSQNANLAAVGIGGSQAGVYKIFEPVDEIFLNRYLPREEQGGDLYKANRNERYADYTLTNTYGVSSKKNGVFYNFDLKTNKETSNHYHIQRFLNTVNGNNVTKSQLEDLMDTDYFLRFLAVSYIVGDQDSMKNNFNNNYIYFRPSDGKAIFIPYDLDYCLGCTYTYTSTGNGMSDISPYSDVAEGQHTVQTNPLINLTVTKDGLYKDRYTQYLKDISRERWMAYGNFENYYNKAKRNYGKYVISNLNYFSTMGRNIDFSTKGGPDYNGNMSVEEFMSKIKQTIDAVK